MAEAPDRKALLRGVLLGLSAAFAWAVFNVGTELGVQAGLSAGDMVMLRFGGAAVILLPFVLRGWQGMAPLRVLTVAVLIGPLFAMLLMGGFAFAPLAHAVVISPGVSMLTTTLLVALSERRVPGPSRLVGIAVLILGLLAIGADRPDPRPSGGAAWIGDLCFVGSGALWGTFVWCFGRWRLPPVQATAWVAVMSALAFAPVYVLVWDVPSLPAPVWAQQVFIHAALGGSGAFILHAMTIRALGPARGATFSAMVPPLAVLLAIPVAGQWPSALAWAGVALASAGLVLAVGLLERRARG